MAYLKFTHAPTTTITTSDYASLLEVWRTYGGMHLEPLVAGFIYEGSLTPAQLRRLPKRLKNSLTVIPEAVGL